MVVVGVLFIGGEFGLLFVFIYEQIQMCGPQKSNAKEEIDSRVIGNQI